MEAGTSCFRCHGTWQGCRAQAGHSQMASPAAEPATAAATPAATPSLPPRNSRSARSRSGWPRPRPSSSTGSPRQHCWRGAPPATASWWHGAQGRQWATPQEQLPARGPHAAGVRPRANAAAPSSGPPHPFAPPRRLPTSHPTLIKFSAPLFLRISFGSLGISVGRSSTRAFVACMGKQVGTAERRNRACRAAAGRACGCRQGAWLLTPGRSLPAFAPCSSRSSC